MKKNNDIRSLTYFVEDVVFFKHLVHFVSFSFSKNMVTKASRNQKGH